MTILTLQKQLIQYYPSFLKLSQEIASEIVQCQSRNIFCINQSLSNLFIFKKYQKLLFIHTAFFLNNNSINIYIVVIKGVFFGG